MGSHSNKITFHLIKVFDGPRHDRLRAIWNKLAYKHRDKMNLVWWENPDARLQHAQCLARIWEGIEDMPGRYHVITEHDFLPGPDWLTPPAAPIEAAEYVTRDPKTLKQTAHGIPGAWWLAFDREAVLGAGLPIDLSAGGQFNDPANCLQGAKMVPNRDAWPDHYGTVVGEKGEHLFFSRHYNDPGWTRPAGFDLGDILEKVDAKIAAYEKSIS